METIHRSQSLGDEQRMRCVGAARLSITTYAPQAEFAMHLHADPGFFLLLAGTHIEERPSFFYDQPIGTISSFGQQVPHARKIGPRGALGFTVCYDSAW